MNTLTTVNNTIPASFEGMTKTDLTTRAMLAVEHILENGGALQAAEILSSMEFFIKEMRGHKAFNDYVREEAGKWNGKYTSPSGTKIEVCETGVKYDYSQDAKWNDIKIVADEWNKRLKDHEEKLKKIPAGKLLVDSDTGETYTGPSRSSNSSFKITIAK